MKRLFLSFLLLASCAAAAGQNALYEAPFSAQATLVRAWTNGRWVTYCGNRTPEKHFVMTDLVTAWSARIDDELEVKDFEIYENRWLVFCGRNTATAQGFIGWFDIRNYFLGNSPAYIDQTLLSSNFASLDNIEVFRDNTTQLIHICGYGQDPSAQYHAFEATGTSLSALSYRARPICFASEPGDMAVTDNYVVISDNISRAGILLHRFDKYAMLSSPNDWHYFQTHSFNNPCLVLDGIEPFGNQLHIVHTIGDNVATLSINLDSTNIFPCGTQPQSAWSLILRQFDMALGVTMMSADRYKLPSIPYPFMEFVYNANESTFLCAYNLLTNNPPNTYNTYNTYITKFINAGAAIASPAWSDKCPVPNKISSGLALDGGTRYLASGADVWAQMLTFYKGDLYDNAQCNEPFDDSVSPIPTTESKSRVCDVAATQYTPLVFLINKPQERYKEPIATLCE